jgi:hypothetical protein
MLWFRGTSHFGTKLEVLCGPVGSTDLYRAQHYTVFPERLQVVAVSNARLAETKCSQQTPPTGGYLTNLRKS